MDSVLECVFESFCVLKVFNFNVRLCTGLSGLWCVNENENMQCAGHSFMLYS